MVVEMQIDVALEMNGTGKIRPIRYDHAAATRRIAFGNGLGDGKTHTQTIELRGDERRAMREGFAFRNGSLQGAYLMMAARSIGLDCGPMSGFDQAKVDAVFFPGSTLRSNFLCNLGYGDPAKVMERLPRMPFEQACQLL